jgi:plastocyanin
MALLGALAVNAAPVAHAATNYTVVVGMPTGSDASQAPELDAGCWAESMRYFPGRMSVHKGDTITFTGGFHTATMLPTGTDAGDWVDHNATNLGDPYTFLTTNLDDAANPVKFNNAAIFGPPTCGSPEAPCDYTGNDVVNSGVWLFGTGSFTATVDANPGDYFWVVCLIHTHMRMKINVVPESDAATSQSAIDSGLASTVAKDQELAQALDSSLNEPTSRNVDGKKVWDAYSGFDAHNVTLYRMYPRKLTIAKGDSVRWHFRDLVNEIHTTTFPIPRALELAETVGNIPSCDPDEGGPGPNNPPDLEGPPFCSDPTQLELTISAEGAFPQGDGVYKGGEDFENSGVRGANLTPPSAEDAPYDLRFSKTSSKKGFKYLCLIHPFMRGTVVVK